MPQPIDTAYVVDVKYLFKTGLDSYVLGVISTVTDTEIVLKNAMLQIPPTKIANFMERLEPMTDQALHDKMIINRINIDWAVPVK